MFLRGSVQILCTCTLVHSPNMSVFPHAQWSLVRHLHQYICHWSAFPCTSANVCFERVLVGLCRQRSSIVHMRMDPLFVCCSTVLLSIVVSGFSPLFPLHIISVWPMPFVPSVWGLMAGLPAIGTNSQSESSWMSGALNLYLVMLLLTCV